MPAVNGSPARPFRNADFSPQDRGDFERGGRGRARASVSGSCGLKSACRFLAGQQVREDEEPSRSTDAGGQRLTRAVPSEPTTTSAAPAGTFAVVTFPPGHRTQSPLAVPVADITCTALSCDQ